jgi:hypothetical protein
VIVVCGKTLVTRELTSQHNVETIRLPQ